MTQELGILALIQRGVRVMTASGDTAAPRGLAQAMINGSAAVAALQLHQVLLGRLAWLDFRFRSERLINSQLLAAEMLFIKLQLYPEAAFRRCRANATRPPKAMIKPGRPAPAIGPGTAAGGGGDCRQGFRSGKYWALSRRKMSPP